jgi:hypothetical protein
MPRLQFMRGGWIEKSSPGMASIVAMDESDKRELRQEIKYWWQAVAEHLDKVVCPFFFSPFPISVYLNIPVGGRVLR